jgi:hypothetical protein
MQNQDHEPENSKSDTEAQSLGSEHSSGSFDQVDLTQPDIDIVDRMFNAEPGSFVPQDDRDHAVMNLFGLLDTPVSSELQRGSRIDLVQLLAARLEDPSYDQSELSQEDQLALDTYIEQNYIPDQISEGLKPRALICDQIGEALITSSPDQVGSSADRNDLIDRTLSTIQNHIELEEASMSVTSQSRGGLSIRWGDLISVAAMLLIIGSIAMPIMSGVRSSSQQAVCFDNMNTAANAFGLYAGSNRDMLPMATAGFGSTWMDVGSTPDRSNSSNLYTLIRTGTADLEDLACPTNPNAPTDELDPEAWDWRSLEEISYSYRIMPPGGMRASDVQPVRVVLLADRSPVVLRVAQGVPIIPEENSPNHNGSGQHMLMLDGSSQWSKSPVINGQDNIWLPRPIERVIHQARSKLGVIKGSELPDGPTDAFVGP